VHIFGHVIRRPAKEQLDQSEEHRGASRDVEMAAAPRRILPTFSVHVDQSYEAALSRVWFHCPKDAEQLLEGRVQLLNIWRPIKTVKRDPLAIGKVIYQPLYSSPRHEHG
jgi:hypothetical protein